MVLNWTPQNNWYWNMWRCLLDKFFLHFTQQYRGGAEGEKKECKGKLKDCQRCSPKQKEECWQCKNPISEHTAHPGVPDRIECPKKEERKIVMREWAGFLEFLYRQRLQARYAKEPVYLQAMEEQYE